MTQNARLLVHLETRGPITQRDAFILLGIMRLSQRVRELEDLGYVIQHERIKVPTREGEEANVTRYTLISEPARAAA